MNMAELEQTQQFYSDFYKELYGFRPRPSSDRWNDIAWLDAQIQRLRADQPRVEADEKAAHDAAAVRFEDLIAQTISAGARDRATAILWLRDATDDQYYQHDDGYFEYTHGLPYGYLRRTA